MSEEILETPSRPLDDTKSTNWTKVILATVLGFVLLAGSAYAGYYYGAQQVQQPEKPTPVVSQPVLTPTPKTTPTPTPVVEDVTKDWKLYTNEEYSFSFRYPQDWRLEIDFALIENNKDQPEHVVKFALTIFKLVGLGSPQREEGTHLAICHNSAGHGFIEWLEKVQAPEGIYKGGQWVGVEIPQEPNSTVGGISAYQSFYDGRPQAPSSWNTYVTHKKAVFHAKYINFSNYHERGNYDQILSTFKFLD